MKQPVVLRIYKADQLVGVKQFTEGQAVIGRQSDVQVPINDESVSIIHAAVEERDGAYYVCDLGSETGTFKNGESVLDARLESGDIIKVGDFRIEFFIGVPKPKAPPVTAAPSAPAPTPVPPPAPVAPPPQPQAPIEATPEVIPPRIPDAVPPSVSAGAGMGAGGMAIPFTNAPELRPPGSGPAPRGRRANDYKKAKASKSPKTFAPPSKYQSFREFVKPSKGTVVEVLVMWRERVLRAYHFTRKATITMGSHPSSDITLPIVISKQRKIPLVRIDSNATVLIQSDYSGELIKGQQSQSFAELARANRMNKETSGYGLALDQGEMIRIEFAEQVSVIIRYTSDSPKPVAAPFLDLSPAELAGLIMAFVMSGVLWLYTMFYTPPKGLGEDLTEDPNRIAKIEFEQPKAQVVPVPLTEEPVATPPPTKSTPTPQAKPTNKPEQHKAQNPDPNPNAGKAANAAPNKNPKNSPRIQTSIKQGGAVKTGKTEGAQAKSERDVKRVGVFSVFGAGRQTETDASYNGKGELSGMADAATGKAGQNENRPGEGLGSKIKDTGRGGTGTAAVGVQGGDPKGRGSGNSGYGTGGLGKRTGVSIVPGGTEESFSGGYDKEAVRRVVRANLRQLQTCYERQLNRNPDLFGKVVMEWAIGEQGRVVSARVKSSEVGSAVADCVRDIIRTLKFPEPPANNEVTVVYPFYFSN